MFKLNFKPHDRGSSGLLSVTMARARAALLLACIACATVATVAADGEDEGLGSAIAKIDKLHLGFGGACGYAGGKLVKGVALSIFKTGLALYVAAHLPALLTHLGQKKLANVVAEKEKKLIAAERELEGRARQLFRDYVEPHLGARGRREAAGVARDVKPWVEKHTALSGGFAAGFVAAIYT